ncbi:hypothetical protein SDC49_11455 [Lactobacillus sp. R2/2]|nr:hypothetical protein [Lactobacillus sp. R2/2]
MENLNKAKQLVQEAEAVVIVAGNGLAKVEGLDLLGQVDFERDFPSIAQKYDVHSVGYALDQHIPSWSEKWQLWSSLVQKYSFDYRPSSALKICCSSLIIDSILLLPQHLVIFSKLPALTKTAFLMYLAIGLKHNVRVGLIMALQTFRLPLKNYCGQARY